jgi:hypothetical protein
VDRRAPKTAFRLAAIVLATLMLFTALIESNAQAQTGGQAGLVVRFGDDRVESRCVAFDEAEISGYSLLQRSGLAADIKPQGQGGLVCAIEGTGCGIADCLCQCQGDPCVYWSYWRLADDGWSYSAIGATTRQLSDGDVDGWSWGPGSVTSAIQPPQMTFDEICGPGGQQVVEIAGETSGGAKAEAGTWLPYAALALLLVILGSGALFASRRKSAL